MFALTAGRLAGLDAIRFICAAIVALGHLHVVPLGYIPDDQILGRLANAFLEGLFNGPAAVIVFFVISGLCIHFPQAGSGVGRVDLAAFYARRFVRIGVPAVVSAAIVILAGGDLEPPLYGVLWSVICEAVYYLLYPALLMLTARVSWSSLIAASTALAMGIAVSNLDLLEGNAYPAFGAWTWVLGLPCWLLGCWLAENLDRFRLLSTGSMWKMRLGLLAVTMVMRHAKFQLPSPFGSNVFLLTVLAFGVVVWLGYEMRYFRSHQPSPWLERAGSWSYSLYLVHPIAPLIWLESSQGLLQHWLLLSAAVALSYAFFRVVELPSHRLAKQLAQALRKPVTPSAMEAKV